MTVYEDQQCFQDLNHDNRNDGTNVGDIGNVGAEPIYPSSSYGGSRAQALANFDNQHQQYDVIIIGAGLSGLYAANTLLENCDPAHPPRLCLLEARDRVGGRTYTKTETEVGGYVDLGGSYVGPNQRYMHRLIKRFNLQTFKVNGTGNSVYLNRRKRFIHQCDRLPSLGSVIELEIRHVMSLIEQMCSEIPVESPWTAPNAHELDRMTFEQFLLKHCWTREAREFISIYMGCCTSCEAHEASLLWTLWFVRQCDGLDMMFNIENAAQDSKIVGGTQQISERLYNLIDGSRRVKLNQAVMEISCQSRDTLTTFDDDFDDRWQHDDCDVTIRTLNGSQYRCRYVIMTIPIPLQQKIHYNPPLSPLYSQLMQKFPMGSAIKCIVYYESPFWRADSLTGSLMINEQTEVGPITYTLDDTKPDGTYPAIVGFIIGDRARAMLQRSKQERLQIICDSYARAFQTDQAKKPIHYEEHNWMSEQYTGGCFTSFGTPGFLTTYGELLRKPRMMGRIYSAGTETATHWSGYMDGALQAGERAALQVLQKLRSRSKEMTNQIQNYHCLNREPYQPGTQIEPLKLNPSFTPSINQLLTLSSVVFLLFGFAILLATF